jgi:transposase InsO family protein
LTNARGAGADWAVSPRRRASIALAAGAAPQQQERDRSRDRRLAPAELRADVHGAREAFADCTTRYFNPVRRHSTLGYLSPIEFENQHHASRGRAA